MADLATADRATADLATVVPVGPRRRRRREPTFPPSTSWERTGGLRAVGRYTLLVVITLIVMFPIYVTVVGALKPRDRVLRDQLVPNAFTLQTFVDAWNQGSLGRFLFNSAVVAVAVTVAQVVTSLMAAYAFAMLRWPGRTFAFGLYLATLLVPLEATIVVNRRTVDSFGWINSYWGLTIPFAATAFGTFLVRQALLSLPRDLLDAARIDGVGHIGFLRHVALPLCRPTLGALGLFSFLGTWNMYMWPQLITTNEQMNTVQSGLRRLKQQGLDAPNVVMAGTLIAAVPIVIVLLAFQRQLIRGLTAGAVKG